MLFNTGFECPTCEGISDEKALRVCEDLRNECLKTFPPKPEQPSQPSPEATTPTPSTTGGTAKSFTTELLEAFTKSMLGLETQEQVVFTPTPSMVTNCLFVMNNAPIKERLKINYFGMPLWFIAGVIGVFGLVTLTALSRRG